MNVEELREACLTIKGATESFPFDDINLVFKVMDKMFALIPLDETQLQISLKCDPEKAVNLRENYACVEAAYHFNKKYWNTIYLNRDMPQEEVLLWIDHSVKEVLKKLPKKQQQAYENE